MAYDLLVVNIACWNVQRWYRSDGVRHKS